MKKIYRNSQLIALAFLTIFLTSSASAADSSRAKTPVPAELKFKGMIHENPLFQLNIAGNQEQDDFSISIADANGYVLYRENIKAESFTKRFMLNKEELGNETLYFTITSRKTRQEIVYAISSEGHYVNEIRVNQVK